MLFFLNVKINQPTDMPIERFYEIWDQEAQAALGAKEAGVVKGIWKVVARRQVLLVIDVPSHDDLDRAIASLPIFRAMGGSMDVEILPIRPYESFAEDLAKEAGRA